MHAPAPVAPIERGGEGFSAELPLRKPYLSAHQCSYHSPQKAISLYFKVPQLRREGMPLRSGDDAGRFGVLPRFLSKSPKVVAPHQGGSCFA